MKFKQRSRATIGNGSFSRGSAAYGTRKAHSRADRRILARTCLDVTKPRGVKGGAPLALRRNVSRLLHALTSRRFAVAECESQDSIELPYVADELVARAIEEWQARASCCPWEPISDPGWRVLLELLEAEIQGRSASLGGIRNVCAVRASTADRSLRALERHGLVIRGSRPLHPEDGIVSLSRKGSLALRRYFGEVLQSRGPS